MIAQRRSIEVLVSRDFDLHHFVAASGIDVVSNHQFVLRVGAAAALVFDFSFKIAAALQIVQNVAPPLIEQIVIQGVLLKDGDQLLQLTAAEFEAFDG